MAPSKPLARATVREQLVSLLRQIQTGHVINTIWAKEGTVLCAAQMTAVRILWIWPIKAITPFAYLYWTRKLLKKLFNKERVVAKPAGFRSFLRAAVVLGAQELLSLLLGIEALFYLYYVYKKYQLQAPAIPPRMPSGRPLDILRRTFQATKDIQACGRLLVPSPKASRCATPHLSPSASAQDLQRALHPVFTESNVEQLLREWDSRERERGSASSSLAPAVLLSEKERLAMERLIDDAEMLALKHAEISGWFLERRRPSCRWPAAEVDKIRRGNLAEWMAWAFFHCLPNEVPADRQRELDQLIDEGAAWAGVRFKEGYNPDVQTMRLTMDPIPSEHRPLVYYLVTALAFPLVTGLHLENLGFGKHKSGTLSYWLRQGNCADAAKPPIVFCHGIGVNLLPYAPFIGELLKQVGASRSIFLVSLPHISMRIKEDVPSSAEMTASLSDMLASWGASSAHFVGHSFGTVLVAWMAKRAPELVSAATFIDPVCFLLIKPDVCYNFMYRQPETATQLLLHYFVARELFIAHSLSRNFFWYQNLLWPEELSVPSLVVLCGEDSIVPAHSVRRYLTAHKQQTEQLLRLLWFPNLGHGEINFGPVGLAACKRIVSEMVLLEGAS